jgi:hypothetical protein
MTFSDEYKPCIHNLHVTQTEGNSKIGEVIAKSVIMSGYLGVAMNTDVHSRPCASLRVSTKEIIVLAIVGPSLVEAEAATP